MRHHEDWKIGIEEKKYEKDRKVYNIRRTKAQNLNASRLIL